MAKKKNKQLIRPWCWYCEREFEDEKVLMQHQKAKHFKCGMCPRRLNTAGGLAVHIQQVHKLEPENLPRIENALPGRDGYEVEIFGMEGIPAPDVADYKRRKEIELGLAAGTISQPAPKRQKVENRPLSEDELRAQLEAHKALMGVGQAPEAPTPSSDASAGGVVYGAPTYISPPVPSVPPVVPSASPPNVPGMGMFPPPGMSPVPPMGGVPPPFPGAPPPGFPPFAPGLPPGAPPMGFPPMPPPFPPGVTPPFPPGPPGAMRPPFPPPPFLPPGATPPVPGFTPPPGAGLPPPPPTFVPATQKTGPTTGGTPTPAPSLTPAPESQGQGQSQSQSQPPGQAEVRPPQLTLPDPALAQTNPEFKKRTRLMWSDPNFTPEEHRAVHMKYYVKPETNNANNANATAVNDGAAPEESRGKKRARAEDFL